MSKDGGENWQQMGLQKTEHISKVNIHPGNLKSSFMWRLQALCGVMDRIGASLKTTDGGKTWEKFTTSMNAPDVPILLWIRETRKL